MLNLRGRKTKKAQEQVESVKNHLRRMGIRRKRRTADDCGDWRKVVREAVVPRTILTMSLSAIHVSHRTSVLTFKSGIKCMTTFIFDYILIHSNIQ